MVQLYVFSTKVISEHKIKYACWQITKQVYKVGIGTTNKRIAFGHII